MLQTPADLQASEEAYPLPRAGLWISISEISALLSLPGGEVKDGMLQHSLDLGSAERSRWHASSSPEISVSLK